MTKYKIKTVLGCVLPIILTIWFFDLLFEGYTFEMSQKFFMTFLIIVVIFCAGCVLFAFVIQIIMDLVFTFSISDPLVYDFYSSSRKRFGMFHFLEKYDSVQREFAIQEFHKVLKKHPHFTKIYQFFAEPAALEFLEEKN